MSQPHGQDFDDGGVYTGTWINWSRGRIAGATITMSHQNGQLLTAFLALFVTTTGTSFFRLICFALHSVLSSDVPQDAIYHQRQAILRNSTTGINALWSFVQVAWAWRNQKRKALLSRLMPMIGCAVLITSAFSVAGIFVSRVSTSTGDQVLLKGSRCGYKTQPTPDNLLPIAFSYGGRSAVASFNYAQECYNGYVLAQNCKTYIQDNLNYSKSLNASCPFASHMCLHNSSVLQLDTGYLNSHSDFGMNAPPEHRFEYRSVATCAPLTMDGNVRTRTKPGDVNKNIEFDYYFGNLGETKSPDPPTLSRKSVQEPIMEGVFNTTITEYDLWSKTYRGGLPMDQQRHWQAIPELRRNDSDTGIVALETHSVLFIQQVDDPFFSAHRPGIPIYVTVDGQEDRPMPTYYADYPLGILACAMQHQICDKSPRKSSCTPLTSTTNLEHTVNATLTSDLQREYAKSLLALVIDNDVTLVGLVDPLGVMGLDARSSFNGGVQGPLSDRQWEREVEVWWQASLARLQLGITEQATGPSLAGAEPLFRKPQTKAGGIRCRNQMIRSTAYASFSILGIVITFSLGGFLIILSYTLEPCVNSIQRKHGLDIYHRLEWATNGTLQLQRLAHEELGLGTWAGTAAGVPIVVGSGDRQTSCKLAMVNVSDVDHPKLAAPPETLEKQMVIEIGKTV